MADNQSGSESDNQQSVPPNPAVPPATQSPDSIPIRRHVQWGKTFGIAVIVLLVLIAVGLGGYYLAQHQPTPVTTPVVSVPVDDQSSMPALDKEPSGTDVASTYKVSGIVQWQDPVKIDPVAELDSKVDHNYDTAYKVGTFVSGPYKGGDLLIGQFQCDCMGSASFHAVKKDNKYILLARYTSYEPTDVTTDLSKFKIDSTYTLPDLEFPQTLRGPKPRQQLNLERVFFGNLNFFKLDNNIKPAFVDPVVGQVYMTIDNYDDTLVDSFRGNGFYFKAPDSTVVPYSLVVDFVGADNVPQITWSDNSVNHQEYTYKEIGGCGAQNYAYVISADDLKIDELISAGTNSQGDSVYTLKDPNHSLLKDLYNNHYYVPAGQTKLAYNDFVKTRPLFFWYDSFGRLIKFQNSQFLPQAECAKPVIYLYPEQRESVNVQIWPQGGWLKSEPAYGKGWNVLAEPSGQLTNLADHKQYPYLFWEGRGGYYQTPDKGFVVAQAEVAHFLDDKLLQLGLNDREAADFKEFWLPKMQHSPYYFVTFMGNQIMDQLAPLRITPQPDTVIRILMDFKPLAAPIPVKGYNIYTPERRGFTVVEWGGVLR